MLSRIVCSIIEDGIIQGGIKLLTYSDFHRCSHEAAVMSGMRMLASIHRKQNNYNILGRSGGEKGIRTLDTVARIHAFQACAFDHSATSPRPGYPPFCRLDPRTPAHLVD